MKRILLLLGAAFSIMGSYAQTSYTTSYTTGVGNPGGLNTDNDDVVTGWTTIIGASISTNQWSSNIAIPFAFNYFGTPVTYLKASANGLITFDTATTLLPNDNASLPTATLPDSTIACFWDAFTSAPPTASNDVVAWKVWGTAPNRQLWIKWASYEIGAPSVNNASFMCMLEEGTDKIYLIEGLFAISAATQASTTSAGIQLNNSTGFMYGNAYRARVANTNVPTDNNVITFTPFVKTPMAFNSIAVLQPSTKNVSRNGLNEEILRIDVDMSGELSPASLTQLSLGTAGTSNNADITNARVFYCGNDSNFSKNVQFGSTITSPGSTFNVTGTQPLLKGKNYFWLTYTISNTATVDNVIDAICTSATIAGTPQVPSITAPSGSRTIKAALSGTVSVGAGNTYVYLSDVFKEINTNGLSGNVTLSITSDIDDTASAALNYSSGSDYTIKIVPSADVLRNITFTGSNTYLDFSGSKFVSIDGKGPVSGTGKYLRFLNKDIVGSTINFSNGSRFDTIRNCIIESAINSSVKGMIHLGTSTGTSTGIRNIVIENNDLRDRSDSVSIPSIMIYSSGSADLTNGNILVSNNNIFNFRRSAVFIASAGNDGNFTISNNHMFYNASTAPTNGDVVPIMFIPGSNSDNNLISGNYIGGQAPFCGGSAWLAPNNINWVAMNLNSGFITGTSVQGNTIQNINMTGTGTLDFAGIRVEIGKMNIGTVTGNLIGHPTTPNSIVNNMKLTLCIYIYLTSAGEVNVANNIVANITGTGTSTTSGVRGISFQSGGAIANIYNNTVYNLTSAGTQTGPTTSTLHGIGIVSSPEVGPVAVRNNRVYNLTSTATAANVVPTGITIDHATPNGIVEGNIIYNINGLSTGTTAAIHGLYIQGGTKSWVIRNNTVAITNGTNTNSITIRGISDNNANNTNTYVNNTVYVGGTAASGTYNSYAFERRLASAITIRNNIFYNERSGGSGVHAAIGNVVASPNTANNWNSNTSGYNLLISKSSNTIGAWSATPVSRSFTQWRDTSSGDFSSWSDTSLNIPAASFFKNLANGDLTIDSSNALCWYANGKGIAISGNTTDINGQPRSSSIQTGGVDIGADEFPTTTLPPLATVTGNITATDSSSFTFAGRTLGRIYWLAGSLPTAVDLRYFSGSTPPSVVAGKNYFNSYYQFIPTGGSSYNTDVKLYYDSALFGTVPNAASINMASLNSATWTNDAATVVNTTEASFRSNGLTSLNIFTGTDASNPLPVKLLKISAEAVNAADVTVYWSTASEKNTDRFEVEVSDDKQHFVTAGVVKARGNSETTTTYSFEDVDAFRQNTTTLYYRLKMIDENGAFDYSKTVAVSRETSLESTVELYPNPYNSSTQLVVTAATEEKGTMEIVTLSGTVVANQYLLLQKGINTVPPDFMNALPSGMYFIKVTIGNEAYNLKLIK